MEELRRLRQPQDPYRWYDGPMPGWKWVVFDGAVSHMVPNELRDIIVIDLERRGCAFGWENEGKTLFLDQPGPIATTRPVEKFVLDGLELEIPSEDVGHFTLELAEMSIRGGCYYKLHGFHRCIVLTQALRDELLLKLREVLPSAEARAAEFWAGRKTPAQVFRQAAGVPEEVVSAKIDEYFPDRLQRFNTKGSGSLPN
jgi:hypothetical protein